jgi:hypothetical protein
MSIFAKFEDKLEGAVEGAAGTVFAAPIEPAQIAKRAEKQMKRAKLVGSGKQYAPTLYNVLVNPRDDKRLFGFYPTMATEIENYIYARGLESGLEFDTRPLVRFIADEGLKKGKFDVIAEVVAAPTIMRLREEELVYYGIKPQSAQNFESPRPVTANQERRAVVDGLDVPVDVSDIPAPALPSLAVPQTPPLPGGAAASDQDWAGFASFDAQAAGGAVDNSRSVNLRAALSASNQADGRQDADSADAGGQPSLGSAALYMASEHVRIALPRQTMTIGRAQGNDIVLADANASRIHARLSQDATGRWKVVDMGSTNGILLNGKSVQSALLRDGDELTIGATLLEFNER